LLGSNPVLATRNFCAFEKEELKSRIQKSIFHYYLEQVKVSMLERSFDR